MSEEILRGPHRAKAVRWELAKTNSGREQVAIQFLLIERGDYVTYYGFFTDATIARTFESLRICGWTGDDLTNLEGLDLNEVELEMKPEEYKGQLQNKVGFINRPGGGLRVTPMEDAEKRAFAARMKAAAVASRTGMPKAAAKPAPQPNGSAPDTRFDNVPPLGADDVPF